MDSSAEHSGHRSPTSPRRLYPHDGHGTSRSATNARTASSARSSLMAAHLRGEPGHGESPPAFRILARFQPALIVTIAAAHLFLMYDHPRRPAAKAAASRDILSQEVHMKP